MSKRFAKALPRLERRLTSTSFFKPMVHLSVSWVWLFQPAVPAILTVIKPSARIYSRLVKRKGPEIISACTCEGTKSEARDWHGEEKNAWECIKTEERCSISQQEMISRKVNGLFSPIRPNGLAKSLHINLDLHEEKSLHLQSLTVTCENRQ